MTDPHYKQSFDSPQILIPRLRKYYDSQRSLFERTGHWVSGQYVIDTTYADYADEWQRRIKPLRNVVPRAVDFYGLKMLPGNVEVITDSDPLKEAVEQVLKWSNFEGKKKLWLTDLSLTGDLFLLSVVTATKTFIQYILPEDVTYMEEDFRGYLQEIRIDYMIEDENGALITHTEYWNKQYYSIWEHVLGREAKLEELPNPIDYGMLAAYGLDFCPVVHIKFKDVGNANFRGVGCVTQSLPVIEEACRQATIMAKTGFRDQATWTLSANSVDANNFTLDPIKVIKSVEVIEAVPGESQQNVTPDDIWQLPAMSTITSLLNGINWSGLQELVDSTMEELNQEIPALRYWALKDQANIAAKTVTLLLDAALSQARESAGSFTAGLIRAVQICLTMGIYSGLFKSALGTYQNGDLDFTVKAGEAFEPTMDDHATTLKLLKDAGIPLEGAMKLAGFTQEEIDESAELNKAEQAGKIEQLKTALMGINEANVKPEKVTSDITK